MNDYGWGMFKKGLKRRSKEVRRMRVMTCLAVCFLAFTMLFQDNVNAFQMELNYNRYGKWAVETRGETPSAASCYNDPVTVSLGSAVYRTYPVSGISDVILDPFAPAEHQEDIVTKPIFDENGDPLPLENDIVVYGYGSERTTSTNIGVMPNDFAERNGIELYEGRLPEAADEIAMELSVLQKLGLNYEIGQTVEFYTAAPFIEPGTDEWREIAAEFDGHPPEDLSYIELHLSGFTLVGTIKRYTFNWENWWGLPNALITREAFDALDMNKQDFNFYEFRDEFVDYDIWRTASSMFEAYGNTDETGIVCNKKTYSNPFWGNPALYKGITLLLVLMSAAIIAYLMSVYLGKRRKFFIGMREIGAATGEIFRMSVYECVVSVLPSAIITLLCSYAAAAILTGLLSLVLRLPFTFVFRPKTLLLTVTAITVTLLSALIVAFIVFAGRGLHEKKKQVSRSAAGSFRNRAKRIENKSYLSLLETLRRSRRLHPFKTTAVRLVSILVCCVTIFALTKIVVYWHSYYVICAEPDITADCIPDSYGNISITVDAEPHWNIDGTKRITTDHLITRFGGHFYSVDEVISEEQILKLNEIPGLEKVTLDTFDATHYLAWDGQEDDAFINECASRAVRAPGFKANIPIIYDGVHQRSMELAASKAFYRLFCYGDAEDIWKQAADYLDKSVADHDAFLRGEQIILVVDETGQSVIKEENPFIKTPEETEETETTPEPEITNGDLLSKYPLSVSAGSTVFVERLKEKIEYKKDLCNLPVTIAAVIPLSQFECGTGTYIDYDDGVNVLFSVVGSAGLARRVMETDGMSYGANVIEIELNALGKKERSESEVIKVLNGNNVNYYSYAEHEEQAMSLALEKTLTYGPFALALIILWIFVMTSVAREERALLEPCVDNLIKLGEDRDTLKKQKRSDAALQSLWNLLAVPLYSAVVIGAFIINTWIGYHGEGVITESAKAVAKQNFINALHSRFFMSELAYTGNYVVQVTVITALLFCIALYLINKKLEVNE